jgi:hypothetical protein
LKILIVSQYFWPEQFKITDLALGLKDKFELDVLTGYPNYPDGSIYTEFKKNRKSFNKLKNINIIRVPIFPRKNNKLFLFLNYLSFMISSSLYIMFLLKKKYNLVFTYQTSPISAGICSIILKKIKKIKHIMWVQDLWPDTFNNVISQEKNVDVFKSKLIQRLIKNFSFYVYRNCDLLIAQSEGIKRKLNIYLKKKVPIDVVRNWAEKDYDIFYNPKNLDYPKKKIKDFDIIVTGNIGIAQDIESIFKCIKLTNKYDKNIRWIFLGKGSMFKWLDSQKKKFHLNNLYLLGSKPEKLMNAYYNLSNALLVSLKAGPAYEVVVPSRFVTYLKSSKPILGMINGETNNIINENKVGFSCKSGNYLELFRNIKKLKKNYLYLKNKISSRSKKLYKASFDRKKQISKIEKIFKDCK